MITDRSPTEHLPYARHCTTNYWMKDANRLKDILKWNNPGKILYLSLSESELCIVSSSHELLLSINRLSKGCRSFYSTWFCCVVIVNAFGDHKPLKIAKVPTFPYHLTTQHHTAMLPLQLFKTLYLGTLLHVSENYLIMDIWSFWPIEHLYLWLDW